jgi:cell division protein ZapA
MALPAHRFVEALGRGPTGPHFALLLSLHPAGAMSRLSLVLGLEPKMAEIDIIIAGRPYKVACRDGEEETLKAAARLVDSKSREALAGLGALSEARQLLFAGLLLADQLIDQKPGAAAAAAAPAPDAELAGRAEQLAERLESLAEALEGEARNT